MFDRAYEFATREQYGNLTIDFRPKFKTKVFRRNLSEVIVFVGGGMVQLYSGRNIRTSSSVPTTPSNPVGSFSSLQAT